MTINNNRVSSAFADNKEDDDQQQARFLRLILRGGAERTATMSRFLMFKLTLRKKIVISDN